MIKIKEFEIKNYTELEYIELEINNFIKENNIIKVINICFDSRRSYGVVCLLVYEI